MKPLRRVRQSATRFLPSRDPDPVQLGRAVIETLLQASARDLDSPAVIGARFLEQLDRHCIALLVRAEP